VEAFLPHQADSVVCVVSPNKNVYSETFIRAHIERLPAQVRVLYGGIYEGTLPQYTDNGQPLFVPVGLPRRITRSLQRRLFKLPWDHFQKSEIRQFLLQNKVDVVLAEYGPTGVVMMDVCQQAGVPLVVHFHGYDAYKDSVLERAGQHYYELFKSAAAIIAVSRDMESQLLRLGAPREKLHYNPYGVDTSLFQEADPRQAPPIFVAVGRFVDKKAPYLTLLAFGQVLKRIPEAKLVMVGDGPLWEACMRLSQALGLEASVDLLGQRPHAEVAIVVQQARAFVQHSLRTICGDSEGTPVAVLEAGATALPVVATRHAGIPEVVIHGETGLLVDEGDVSGMAEYMIQLSRDPALAARLGKAARERVCAEFTMEKSIRNLWRIIETAIEKHQV